MSNPLEELEEQADARKRTGRQPGGSRNPRRKPTGGDDVKTKAAAELAAREKEAERRRAEREAEEKAPADSGPTADEPDGSQGPPEPEPLSKRPKSTPFYPNPEDEDFLWQVHEAATARREKIPTTAVLRFALRRLSDQMTPSEIVRALSGPVQTRGKMGRPRR
ncbi:hypothetical protein [Streptomyces sp. NRRL F-5065]|uniref:hypothetical protein n=1 Tax=Streptomyces sp. NRRL F-5065 TaxID=1463855 RepID=UPI00056D5E0B|nr:hypothetical protein [Streptomyces sp. NRRL F-5065]